MYIYYKSALPVVPIYFYILHVIRLLREKNNSGLETFVLFSFNFTNNRFVLFTYL